MKSHFVERVIWIVVIALLLVAYRRWNEVGAGSSAEAALIIPSLFVGESVVSVQQLSDAGEAVMAGNLFRLDRAPAPVGFARRSDPNPVLPLEEQTPTRPQLSVAAIVGPPWAAVLEGLPGHEGGVLIREGITFGEYRIRSVTQHRVIVEASDTTWRLPLKNPWQ